MERLIKREPKSREWALHRTPDPKKAKPRYTPSAFATPEAACDFAVRLLAEPVVRRLPASLRLDLFDRLSTLAYQGTLWERMSLAASKLPEDQQKHYRENCLNNKLFMLLYDGPV